MEFHKIDSVVGQVNNFSLGPVAPQVGIFGLLVGNAEGFAVLIVSDNSCLTKVPHVGLWLTLAHQFTPI